jgi:hypothetical protein
MDHHELRKTSSYESRSIMSVPIPEPFQDDWVKTVLFDRGYLAKIRGEAIKVYLAIIEACGGVPDRSVTISLSVLMRRTQLTCPTVIESLARLEDLGLVVSTTHQRGKVKTYYVSNPPAGVPA